MGGGGGGEVIGLVRAVAHIAVPLVAFAVGLSAASAQITWLWRRPALLARSLLAVLVLVPAAALLLVKVIPMPPAMGAGLLIMAISAGPIAALRKSRAGGADSGGDGSYALGLNLSLLLLSIPYVPVAVALLSAAFGRDLRIEMGAVAKVVLPLQLLPLALGIVVARVRPTLAARLVKPVGVVGNALIAALALVIVVALFRPMLGLGARGLLAVTLLAVASVAIGYLCGGPDARGRFVLALFSALRFPALALLLSTVVPAGPRVVPVVMEYLLVSTVVAALVGLATRRFAQRIRGARPRPLTPAPAAH